MTLYEKKFNSTFRTVAEIVDEVVALLKEVTQLDKSLSFRVGFMLREVLNNAVEHGNAFDEDKLIWLKVEKIKELLVFHVADEGPGFSLMVLEEMPDDIDRVRNRGMLLVSEFGFNVSIVNKTVVVKLDLNEATNT